MSIALVAHGGEQLGTNGGTTAGAGVLNTTGADLLVVVENYYVVGGPGVLTDSKSNSWTKLTQRDGVEIGCVIWYAKNASVGSGHTFTITGSGVYAALEILAASGTHLSAPFDQQNGIATDSALTTLQIGSVTPSTDGQLLVMGLSLSQATPGSSIDIGTLQDETSGLSTYTGASATQIQTTATARNPTWTHASSRASAAIATFKAAAGGGTAYTLDATGPGDSFTITGTAAGLKVGRRVAAASGSFAATGTAANVIHTVNATPGAFTITGTPATLTLFAPGHFSLAAAAGAFSIVGFDATFHHGVPGSSGGGAMLFLMAQP